MNSVEQQLAAAMPDIFGDMPRSLRHPHQADSRDIAEGQRNATLARCAGSLRRTGLSERAISAALQVVNSERCSPPLAPGEVDSIARSIARYQPESPETAPPLVGLTARELSEQTFPERRPILTRSGTVIFRAGHLAELFGARGLGKTWLSQTLAVIAATGVEALGFESPVPCRVLYVNGEDSSRELQDRFNHLYAVLNVPPPNNLTVVAADWQPDYLRRLDTPEGQQAIEPFVEGADLMIADNRSCLFDPEGEKDASAWQPAQDYLLSLRRRGKAVIFAHHANRTGGARGHSKPEDPLNMIIGLSKPDDYQQDQGARFTVTFEKSRDAHGPAVAPFCARLTPSGWCIEESTHASTVGDRLVEYVRLADSAGEAVKSANAAIVGAKVNRNAGLASWAELGKSGRIVKIGDTFHAR